MPNFVRSPTNRTVVSCDPDETNTERGRQNKEKRLQGRFWEETIASLTKNLVGLFMTTEL